jgi:hypothetical protein
VQSSLECSRCYRGKEVLKSRRDITLGQISCVGVPRRLKIAKPICKVLKDRVLT